MQIALQVLAHHGQRQRGAAPPMETLPWKTGEEYRTYHVRRYVDGGYRLAEFRRDNPASLCYGCTETDLDGACACVP